MSYHKYTNGTAFTLYNQDYTGFFNIVQGVPYTGKYLDSDSLELSYKTTFISEFYRNLMEFDVTYNNLPKITPYNFNVFDILNNTGTNEMVTAIDNNNMAIFKGLNISNPTIYNFERNSNLYYGISSSTEEMIGKQTYEHIEPFSTSDSWSFMDKIATGIFFVNSKENFRYYCSTGQVDYIISGSFNMPTTLNVEYIKDLHPKNTTTPDYTYHIHNDYDNSRVFIVNNDLINIYDSSNYEFCENLTLIDSLSLLKTTTHDFILGDIGKNTFGNFHQTFNARFSTINPNNTEFIRFGKNIRTSIDGNILSILNKYSSTIYQTIDLSSYVGTILALDVSPSTDDLIILHEKGGYIWLLTLYNLDITTITNIQLQNIILGMEWYKIKFSNIDSNQIYVYSRKEYQTRYLSNPEHPAGVLDFHRPEDFTHYTLGKIGPYTFDNFHQTFNPVYPEVPRWKEGGLLYFRPNYTFSGAKEKFSGINMKFNSNKYTSNNVNIINTAQVTKNDKMYMLSHNIGRLYALKQPISDNIFIPLNLQKYFNFTKCSESSLGLYFNSILSNLVKDTMNLLTNSQGQFKVAEYEIDVAELHDIIFNMENMYINGNENMNVISMQRILGTISDIQSKLLPN